MDSPQENVLIHIIPVNGNTQGQSDHRADNTNHNVNGVDLGQSPGNLKARSGPQATGGLTSYSLIDMDLCGSTELAFPLTPNLPPLSGLSPEVVVLQLQGDILDIRRTQQHLQTLIHHKFKCLSEEQQQSAMEFRNSLSTLTHTLTELSESGRRDVTGAMDRQFDYQQTQLTATLQWRLQHHHTEVLKDVNSVFSPLVNTVDHLQKELSNCVKMLADVSVDMASIRHNSLHRASLVSTSVQTTEGQAGTSEQLRQGHAAATPYRMQSTMHPGVHFHGPITPSPSTSSIPPSSFVHGDLSRRHVGAMPIKLQFPTFGKKDDSPDPLMYLERCRDFLALNPLADEELLATLRNVLHGTARDWWDVARLTTTSWADFEAKFSSAFLSEDYTDELADRVFNRVQREKESIRDFAYGYHSLCRRWKPGIEEEEVIKLILKNINPLLASQLRERVTTVDGLVRLGQQFEKDRECQQQYEQRKKQTPKPLPKPDHQQQPQSPAKTPPMFCWRCSQKGHSSATCPRPYQVNPSRNHKSQQANTPNSLRRNDHPTLGALTRDETPSVTAYAAPSTSPSFQLIPHQLVLPLSIGPWTGRAILDTGSSYTLLNEKLWKEVKGLHYNLKPWTEGPLYLADGEAKRPLGWSEVEFHLCNHSYMIPSVILQTKNLAFPVVLGIDFMYFSGVQIDIAHNCYWFPYNPSKKHFFQSEATKLHDWGPNVAVFSAIAPVPLTLDNPSDDLLLQAVRRAQLEQPEELRLLEQLQNNADVCTSKLGRTGLLKHKIFLTQEMPIKQKPYRLSPAKLIIQKGLINDMLTQNIIERSSSPWAAPVVLIPKKTGGLRFCVDYRKTNKVSQTDAYPLPTIQEILESLSGAVVFTTLDLNSGYWQVEMDQESKDKTAFVCAEGLFSFKVMPFGLKNAPATFQRLMEIALGELKGKICFVYLDDIIIYSQTREQHFQDLQAVLDKLREAGLTLNMKKSNFCQTSLKFLGHIVSFDGTHVDPEKTKAVQDFPVPTTLKALQRFLGMAGWYHRFVLNFSQVAEPLNALKRKGAKFRWTAECQTSFETLKRHLVTPPILGHPNFDCPFVVYTDASDVGLGAVLVQQTGLGIEEVLAFASRTLNGAERNYSTTEQECLAVVWALEKWRYYLEGRHFTVVTDHSSLVWVFKTNKPSTRLIRWALRLQEFTFAVEYRKGKYNTVPDYITITFKSFSRRSYPEQLTKWCIHLMISSGTTTLQ
ncbi:uncharacterized protein [Salmo salar]|uniref:Reverse transcriptase n=1 Tax=Salmo salar TaxID=8030 RepID=A0ABM3EF25_SALSA|nr:uncharacterized protein LOC123739248 [Salmo salar]